MDVCNLANSSTEKYKLKDERREKFKTKYDVLHCTGTCKIIKCPFFQVFIMTLHSRLTMHLLCGTEYMYKYL